MANLDSILKSRDITLTTKVQLVKAMVFPVVMYGCESWIIKKAECWRIDAFEPWSWKRLLRVPWTARRSNKSILKEINPDYSFEGLILKLTSNTSSTWCEELTHWKRSSCWERLKAGGEGDDRGWDGWMVSLTQWTWVWANFGSWWWTGMPGVVQSMGSQRVGHDWATELYWTELMQNHSVLWTQYESTVIFEKFFKIMQNKWDSIIQLLNYQLGNFYREINFLRDIRCQSQDVESWRPSLPIPGCRELDVALAPPYNDK